CTTCSALSFVMKGGELSTSWLKPQPLKTLTKKKQDFHPLLLKGASHMETTPGD
ncbi:hypothetical protein BHE74_00040111, partial [Ensete ventricosum]